MIVAIDGPAGAGKSSVARQLAERVGFKHLDSGAFYRCFAYIALISGKDIDSADGWTTIIDNHTVEADYRDNPAKFYINGKDVTQAIRDNEVSKIVAVVSKHQQVRSAVNRKLQTVANQDNFIVDGRDIGSAVFPKADLKFFLTASIEERAKRRYLELLSKGTQVDPRELEQEIRIRDQIDSTRNLSPLIQAHDAELVDSTNMNLVEVVEYLKMKIESVHSENTTERRVVNQ